MKPATWILVIALIPCASVVRGEGLWNDENLLSDRPVSEHDLVTVTSPKPSPAIVAGDEKGKASAARKPLSLRDRIVRRLGRRFTARVIETLPNGNLVLESQTVTVRNDVAVETLLIGEIRRQDVSEDRTVPLDRVSEIRFSVRVHREEKKAEVADAGETKETPVEAEKAPDENAAKEPIAQTPADDGPTWPVRSKETDAEEKTDDA